MYHNDITITWTFLCVLRTSMLHPCSSKYLDFNFTGLPSDYSIHTSQTGEVSPFSTMSARRMVCILMTMRDRDRLCCPCRGLGRENVDRLMGGNFP